MVHALQECWRVLTPGAILVDLRPFYSHPPIEIMSGDVVFVPGHLDDENSAADDIAADEAMAEVVRRGYFALERRNTFQFAEYWDSLQGLLDYAAERWSGSKEIPASVVTRAERYIAGAGSDYRVRVQRRMYLAVYRKQEPVKRR